METNKDIITPGGNQVTLANPPSSEVGPSDSGEGQLLLSTDPFSFSRRVLRSPPSKGSNGKENRTHSGSTPATQRQVPEKTPKCDDDSEKLRKRLTEVETLCQVLRNEVLILRAENAELKKDRTQDDNMKKPANNNQDYYTDEEDLTRETDWMIAGRRRRPNKKRKAVSSPEVLETTNDSTTEQKQKQAKETQPPLPKNTVRKQHLPPPIMVSGVERFNELKNIIQQSNRKECKYKAFNNNVWRINVEDGEDYRAVTNALSINKIQWHSYENKNSRPIKVMARGLHPSCEANEIIEDLKENGFNILEAVNIIQKRVVVDSSGEKTTQRRGLPLFMLTFHNQENMEKLYDIKSIMGIIVKIEPLRKRSTLIPQCKRCQAFGHTQGYCNRDFACVKCLGKHSTKNCTLRKEQKPKCVNCREDHPANYRGCIIATKQQQMKNKQDSTRTMQRKVPIDKYYKDNATNPLNPGNNQTVNTKSYAQIVTNTRKAEETPVKEMLNIILQKMNNQDNLIKLIRDEIAGIKKNKEKKLSTNQNA